MKRDLQLVLAYRCRNSFLLPKDVPVFSMKSLDRVVSRLTVSEVRLAERLLNLGSYRKKIEERLSGNRKQLRARWPRCRRTG